jgi:hypothetical protein
MIYLSIALCFVAALARDALRAWLKFKEAREISRRELEALALGQSRHEDALKLLAEDFKKKLQQVEAEAKATQRHIEGTVAGTIAQLPNTGKGFGR